MIFSDGAKTGAIKEKKTKRKPPVKYCYAVGI
jgi:hypothetical protein